MPSFKELLENPEFVAALNEQLARRPAARAQYDPKVIEVDDPQKNWRWGAYDPIADKVLLANDLPLKKAQYTIPHEFEHRAQDKYGTPFGIFGDKEAAVYLGDRKMGRKGVEAEIGLGDKHTKPQALQVVRADTERLQMEDRALRELALRDDDYFYDSKGNRVKANVGYSPLAGNNVAPEILEERQRLARAVDSGNYFEPPSGGQSLLQEKLYNQRPRYSKIAERILKPSLRDRLASFFSSLVGR